MLDNELFEQHGLAIDIASDILLALKCVDLFLPLIFLLAFGQELLLLALLQPLLQDLLLCHVLFLGFDELVYSGVLL